MVSEPLNTQITDYLCAVPKDSALKKQHKILLLLSKRWYYCVCNENTLVLKANTKQTKEQLAY